MAGKIIMFPKTREMLRKLQTDNEQYTSALYQIRSYTVAIKNTTIPALHCGKDICDEIDACYNALYGCATKWSLIEDTCNQVVDFLPQYVEVISTCVDNCIGCINLTKEHPYLIPNELITLEFNLASETADSAKNNVETCIGNISSYINGDAKAIVSNLEEIIDCLLQGESVDKNKIDSLNRDIDKLNKEISQLEAELAGLSVAAASGIAGIVLGGVFAGAFGALACSVIFGVAVVISGVCITLDSIELQACKEQVAWDIDQLNTYEQDAATIQQLQSLFSGYLDGVAQLVDSLNIVNEAWGTLYEDCSQMVEDLSEAESDMTAEDWDAMTCELDEVLSLCAELDEHIKVVQTPETTVSTAKIELGMSEAEIEAAVNAAEVLPYTEYMLKVL